MSSLANKYRKTSGESPFATQPDQIQMADKGPVSLF